MKKKMILFTVITLFLLIGGMGCEEEKEFKNMSFVCPHTSKTTSVLFDKYKSQNIYFLNLCEFALFKLDSGDTISIGFKGISDNRIKDFSLIEFEDKSFKGFDSFLTFEINNIKDNYIKSETIQMANSYCSKQMNYTDSDYIEHIRLIVKKIEYRLKNETYSQHTEREKKILLWKQHFNSYVMLNDTTFLFIVDVFPYESELQNRTAILILKQF